MIARVLELDPGDPSPKVSRNVKANAIPKKTELKNGTLTDTSISAFSLIRKRRETCRLPL